MFRIGRLPRRRTGAALAATLLMGGLGMTALAPAANAGVVNPTVHCVLPAGQGEATGPQSIDVTLTPANAAPGSTVHAVVTLGTGPANSTVSLSDIPTTPSIDLTMSGGATGVVTVTGPTFNIDTVAGQPVQIPTYEGDFIVPNNAQGVVDFAPLRTVTKTVVFGSTFNTPCDVVSGGGSIGTVNVQGPGSEQPTMSAPTGTVRPGYTLNFAGAGFPASAVPAVTLCPAAGGACVLGGFSSSALTVSASGVLSGTAKLGTTGIPDGDYLVKVAAGGKEASSPITVEAFVQIGDRELTISPSSGPVGTVVTVTGSNWSANTSVNVAGLDVNNSIVDTVQSVISSPDGTFTMQYPIASELVTQLRIREGISSTKRVIVPFTVTVVAPSIVASPTAASRNGVVTLSGANWPAGATPTAALCDTSGNNCNAASLTNSTLAISSAGALSGTVKVAGNVTPANYTVKVTASGLSATTPLTVQKHSISLSKSSGPLGTKTWITGDDFADWAWIKLYGVNAAGQKTGDYNYAAADGAGNWITWMYLNDPATVRIVAEETFNSNIKASAPFTYTS